MAFPRDVSLSWGRVAEIKGGQVKVRSRYRVSDFVDVFVPGTSSQRRAFTVKKNDLVMVLSINGVNIAFLGSLTNSLELPDEGYESVTYGQDFEYEEGKLSDQSKEDTDVDEEPPSDASDEEIQSIKIMKKKVVVEGFDEVVLKTKSIKVESENVRIGTEESLKTGIVTQACQCAFTGAFHPEASKTIKASK